MRMTRQDKIFYLTALISRAEFEAFKAEFTEDDPRRSDQLRAIVFWLKEIRSGLRLLEENEK